MITAQDINNIIGITESYELPNELLYLLKDVDSNKHEGERG